MIKNFLIILLMCFVSYAYAGQKFQAGVSVDGVKNLLPELNSNFIDLNYSIEYKPLNIAAFEDIKQKDENPAYKKMSNFIIPPLDYEISLSTAKARPKTDSAANLEMALRKNPNDTNLLFAYAIQLKNENKLQKALEAADRLVSLNPDFALAHFMRGDILRRMEKFQQAANEYIYTTQINPLCADAYYNIAKILELLDNKYLALDYYKTAYKINPNDDEIRTIILNSYLDL